MQTSMQQANIPCKSFHYTAKKKFLTDVVMKNVWFQMKILIEEERFVPYEEAKKIILSNPDKNFHTTHIN
jgi:hypothetical protein